MMFNSFTWTIPGSMGRAPSSVSATPWSGPRRRRSWWRSRGGRRQPEARRARSRAVRSGWTSRRPLGGSSTGSPKWQRGPGGPGRSGLRRRSDTGSCSRRLGTAWTCSSSGRTRWRRWMIPRPRGSRPSGRHRPSGGAGGGRGGWGGGWRRERQVGIALLRDDRGWESEFSVVFLSEWTLCL